MIKNKNLKKNTLLIQVFTTTRVGILIIVGYIIYFIYFGFDTFAFLCLFMSAVFISSGIGMIITSQTAFLNMSNIKTSREKTTGKNRNEFCPSKI